jgi:hypothetical protein
MSGAKRIRQIAPSRARRLDSRTRAFRGVACFPEHGTTQVPIGHGPAAAALEGVPPQCDDPQHVGEEGEPRRPADVNSGTISPRSERKYENRRVQHKSDEAKEWQTSGPKQSPPRRCLCLVPTRQAQVDEQG